MLKTISETRHGRFTDAGLLLTRVAAGAMMLTHGIPKILNYSAIVASGKFPAIFGSAELGLSLAIMAEVGMSILLIFGLLSRLSTIPLIITMLVAAFYAHAGDPFNAREPALLYLTMYVMILLAGPGRYSADHLIQSKYRNRHPGN
ncbi:MAG: DoxX family protein [Lentimicrobium sp.]|nr:DoxX family protein [Lentimicrobium sp.]